MDLDLAGRTALVTGGSGGIGRATAARLLQEGARVALLARDHDALEEAAATLRETGGEVVVVVADTTDRVAVERAVAQIRDLWGGVDVLVNAAAAAAGSRPPAPVAEFDDADLLSEVDTKVLGYVRVVRAVIPEMIARGWGRIINISGRNALVTGSLIGSVRNVGVAAASSNLADELGAHGITVNTVHPGLTLTPGTLSRLSARAEAEGATVESVMGRLGEANSVRRLITADEVAILIAFLASPLSSAISGAAIDAGGGIRGAIHY